MDKNCADCCRRWTQAIACILVLSLSACHRQSRTVLTISAAASVQDALAEIEAAYKRDHPTIEVRNNFGSSGTLAQEIEDGAPVDVFLSAATKPMNDLAAKDLVIPGTQLNLLRNSLVLIAPRDSQLKDFEGLADNSVRLIALGDPSSVPAGQYGKQVLTALDLYDKLQAKLVLGKDVRQVLTYVETGNADAGLVYATDAQISARVRIVATAPEGTHQPIVYPAAVMKSTRNGDAARDFVAYLGGPLAQEVFIRRSFTIAAK